tara:strand:+ start:1992 stop:2399 length:408 start_codon:yes stop_codon:yes gene_type:complete
MTKEWTWKKEPYITMLFPESRKYEEPEWNSYETILRLIRPNKEHTDYLFRAGQDPSWEFMRDKIGGYIQHTILSRDGKTIDAICDEDGLSKELPPNYNLYDHIDPLEKQSEYTLIVPDIGTLVGNVIIWLRGNIK